MFNPFYHPLRQCLLNVAMKFPTAGPFFENRQNFLTTIPDGAAIFDQTINEVDLSRAIIQYNGFLTSSDDPRSTGRLFFTTSTNIRCQCGGMAGEDYLTLSFTVFEIATGLLKTRLAQQTDIPANESFISVPISYVDPDKCLVFLNGFVCGNSVFDPAGMFPTVQLTDPTTIVVSRALANAFSVQTNYILIEIN